MLVALSFLPTKLRRHVRIHLLQVQFQGAMHMARLVPPDTVSAEQALHTQDGISFYVYCCWHLRRHSLSQRGLPLPSTAIGF